VGGIREEGNLRRKEKMYKWKSERAVYRHKVHVLGGRAKKG
jgi:hypothetical protein